MKTVVDVQRIWYGDLITTLTTPGSGLTKADVDAFIADGTTKEITNVHATTWTYEEGEPSTTDYINQLNGQTYYRDFQPAAKSINFSIGQYEYSTKADLQGGTATSTSWKPALNQGVIFKTFCALTKDNTYIIFPKAIVTARTGMVEDKLLGLLFTASPVETGVDNMETEGWFDA